MTPLHLMFLFGAAPAIAYGDYLGSRWMRGAIQTIDGATIARIHRWVYVCLGGIIATGLVMLSEDPSLLSYPIFIAKMAFVLALVLNSMLIGRLMHEATTSPYASLDAKKRSLVLVSGAISIIAWLGAIIGGILIG